MILSFLDKDFKGLQSNASLVIDVSSYSLIRRGVDLDELSCTCEPFTENIQPTFIVVKNDIGNYIYSCLAGIPELTAENKTKITGSDLKTMFKSDVVLNFANLSQSTVNTLFYYVFNQWARQVNQNYFICQLSFDDDVGTIPLSDLTVGDEQGVYDVWEDIFAPFLKFYNLFMTSEMDIVNKMIVFRVGKSMTKNMNIKLWEFGIYDYGKWVADVNETQGAVLDKTANRITMTDYKWILTSQNAITTNADNRDIFPVKRRVILKETDNTGDVVSLLAEASKEALQTLCESLFNENIELSGINADFNTKFSIYVRRGDKTPYKELPCGELHYDASGLVKVQAGYRFTGLQFIE